MWYDSWGCGSCGVIVRVVVVCDVAAKVVRSYPESFRSISLSSVKL